MVNAEIISAVGVEREWAAPEQACVVTVTEIAPQVPVGVLEKGRFLDFSRISFALPGHRRYNKERRD
jgi:hypothetical protein